MRVPRHIYEDPLDRIWISTAAAVGLRIERSGEVYAASNGARTLSIGIREVLDPDDCLAQMILHELCHSLVEGPEAFSVPDWGLDNTSDRDLDREHACLRLQAFLSARHGLRQVLAPTTDHRAFYDALPEDPFEPRRAASTGLAIRALRLADKPPWGPHLERALAATRDIARATASFVRTVSEPPSLWSEVEEGAGKHPLGTRLLVREAPPSCDACGWQSGGSCRQHDLSPVEPGSAACERWEASLDCNECGACCRAAYDSVTVDSGDPVIGLHPELVVDRGTYVELRREKDRCVALAGGEDEHSPFGCTIYGERPQPCRDFERGGEHCLTARRRIGLSL